MEAMGYIKSARVVGEGVGRDIHSIEANISFELSPP